MEENIKKQKQSLEEMISSGGLCNSDLEGVIKVYKSLCESLKVEPMKFSFEKPTLPPLHDPDDGSDDVKPTLDDVVAKWKRDDPYAPANVWWKKRIEFVSATSISGCSKPKGTCYNCGEVGHMSRNCKQPQKTSPGPRVVAAASSAAGGSNQEAIAGTGKPIQGPVPECKTCGWGHFRICPKLSQNCYNCGQEGHYASRCSKPKGTCYNCGEAAHMSRNCKQPQKASPGPRVVVAAAAAASSAPGGSNQEAIAGTGKLIQGVSDASVSLPTERSTFKMDFKTLTQNTISRPLCLYFTLGCCNKMDDQTHIKTFNHGFPELDTKRFDLKQVHPQEFDFFLVLDLKGKVEILEFPVLMIDAKTLKLVDFFHRFVRPTGMSKEYTNRYVDGKYGQFGVNSVWHETAIPFKEVIKQFEDWLATHNMWAKESSGYLDKGAFVTCGNWDIKTKIPEQYVVAGMKLPPYFMEWINLKDIYLNFYNREATGMVPMMASLNMQPVGTHHLEIDDTRNIARVLQRLLIDGALVQITARKKKDGRVEFVFQNRI